MTWFPRKSRYKVCDDLSQTCNTNLQHHITLIISYLSSRCHTSHCHKKLLQNHIRRTENSENKAKNNS
nr:MAG TPA: hypothetical protein [Caudoviricetes sp.]